MSRQFKRKFVLGFIDPTTGGGVRITDLRVTFEITKTLYGYPSLAKISLYNLSRDRVQQISKELTDLVFAVGYDGEVEQIFSGSIRNVRSRREGIDTVTDINAGDAEFQIQKSVFSRTFESGTSIKQIILDVAESFGIPKAKLDGLENLGTSLNGSTFSGKTKEILDKLSDNFGFYWSVQNGNFVTQDRNDYDRVNSTTVITRSTGMLGSPTITELGVNVKTLLNPRLEPYRRIQVKTPDTDISVNNLQFREKLPTLGTGFFRINEVVHRGDTRGNEWSSSIISKRIP